MEMNNRIRKYIKSKGLKYNHVSAMSGIEYKKFSRFMNNKQPMTTDEYEDVCKKGLEVDPSYFYKEKVLETKNAS